MQPGPSERAARRAAWFALAWCLTFWAAASVALSQQITANY